MSERPSGGYGASGRLDQVSSLGNAESIVLHGKLGGVTGLEGAVQHLLGHGVFHLALDGSAQGTGPVLGIDLFLSPYTSPPKSKNSPERAFMKSSLRAVLFI